MGEDDKVAVGESDPSEYDEVITTNDTKMTDAFSSHIICVRMGTAYTGVGLKLMNQALHAEDGLFQDVQWHQECHCGSEK